MRLEEKPKIRNFTATSIRTSKSKPYMLFTGKGNLKLTDNYPETVNYTKVKKLNFFSKHRSE